jgi:hypothetical protein
MMAKKRRSIEDYPPIHYVRQCLRHDDGRLFWLSRPREHFTSDRVWNSWNAKNAGNEAGTVGICGLNYKRCSISINKVRIYRNLIVWALHKDEWRLHLDHENRDPLDDHIENLRIADQSRNMANQSIRSNNKSGLKGVRWRDDCRKWQAEIRVRGHHISLGLFDDPAAAHAAYMEAAKEHFGDFASDGKTGPHGPWTSPSVSRG